MDYTESISKRSPDDPSLDFDRLREEGIEYIQKLSGQLWTDYNLHDPGVTILEVLCYAITDMGYRLNLLKEAFDSGEAANSGLIRRHFFSQDELIHSLPLSRGDFELFIEKNHEKVLSAWFEDYTLLHTEWPVRGGYEIVVMLDPEDPHGDLNTDVIQTFSEEIDAGLGVNVFDEKNKRMNWMAIGEVKSCKLDEEHPDNFFVFEESNCQVSMVFEVVFRDQKASNLIRCNVRVTMNPGKKPADEREPLDTHKDAIVKHLESPEFLETIADNLEKEHYKSKLLTDIQRKLMSNRNLCEDFVELRIVNVQEVKIELEVLLHDDADTAGRMMHRVYDHLDAFLLQMLLRSKKPEQRTQKNVLYASNIIKEVVRIEGIEAAAIRNMNLYIDGIPTILVEDESSFECIHLQRFSHYVPRIEREKSTVTFIRSGVVEKAEESEAARSFSPNQFFGFSSPRQEMDMEIQRKLGQRKAAVFDEHFFEALRQYDSIQNDFPNNYNLEEGQLTESASEKLRLSVRQMKSYLAFYERIFIEYLDKLSRFNDLLSISQPAESEPAGLETFMDEVPGLALTDDAGKLPVDRRAQMVQKNKILDHLLARFSTRFIPVASGESDADSLERIAEKKMQLLSDIPLITRERGLGIPVTPDNKEIWDTDLLSGFQKRVYRLIGVNNDELRHIRLKEAKGMDPAGFYLVEHILLAKRPGSQSNINQFNRDAEDLFTYLEEIYIKKYRDAVKPDESSSVKQIRADSFHYEPYSFQLTVVLPDWYPLWNARMNRVERAISEELPAHIFPYFIWMNKDELEEFERRYENWLKSLLRLQDS